MVGVGVAVAVCVTVEVTGADAVAVGVGVSVTVSVDETVGVGVSVTVSVGETVGVVDNGKAACAGRVSPGAARPGPANASSKNRAQAKKQAKRRCSFWFISVYPVDSVTFNIEPPSPISAAPI